MKLKPAKCYINKAFWNERGSIIHVLFCSLAEGCSLIALPQCWSRSSGMNPAQLRYSAICSIVSQNYNVEKVPKWLFDT